MRITTIFGPRPELSVASKLLIFTTIGLGVSVLWTSIAMIRGEGIGEAIGFATAMFVAWLIVIFVGGPIVGFPGYFFRELLRRSRQPGFSRRKAKLLTVLTLLVVAATIPFIGVSREGTIPLLLAGGSIYARLVYSRSPWPRLLRMYGPTWLLWVPLGAFGIFVMGPVIELPHIVVTSASLAVPLFLLGRKLHRLIRSHRGDDLRFPSTCVMLLRPFGFDDENFAETNTRFFLILEPNRGIPFDAFVRPYVEAQLGTFVSFGDPGDVTYRSGARRYYVTDTRWQSVFEELAPRTTAFLAVVATLSQGFIWELTRLRELDLHTCLFLFTPPSPEPRREPLILRAYETVGLMFWPPPQTLNAEDSWQHAARNLRPLGYQLTEYPGPGAVIGFAPDGTSRILARNCKEPGEFISPVRRVLFPAAVRPEHLHDRRARPRAAPAPANVGIALSHTSSTPTTTG